MPVLADVLPPLNLVLQTGFLAVTLLLLLVTAINRMRVRRVLLSWRRGRLLGLPPWPTTFLAAVLLFLGGSLATGQPLPFFAGYLVGGVFWLAAGLLSASVLVTEYGLVQNANRAEQAVAWGQVVDYFEAAAGRRHRFVFFYLDPTDTRRRLELTVPKAHRADFCRIIRDKVDVRFDLSAQQVYGNKALEG